MSPLAVRRYRAERLLRAEFRRLEARVSRVVARRLAAGGLALDERDIEACYAVAWQGLYEAVIEGQQIANPTGWLVLVTYRRALDEQRARTRAGHRRERGGPRSPARGTLGADAPGAGEQDFAETVDDRERLRQLFEGLRARLSAPEREAAVLCYLHGLTRSEAAASMGISERRMDRLMDGRGPGHEGASAKLGVLVASIREGRWCEQQGSLMRGLAFGILDRRGERYRLALAHSSECPACRAYVASLRGLAAVLPPAPLPVGLAAAILARAAGKAGAAAGSGGQLAGGGVVSGAGAAGAGGAGSGWVLAGGPLGAKLAAGCVLALGIGAGCVGLGIEGRSGPGPRRTPPPSERARRSPNRARQAVLATAGASRSAGAGAPAAGTGGRGGPIGEAARASREFGPEGPRGGRTGKAGGGAVARAASSGGARGSSAGTTPSPAPAPERTQAVSAAQDSSAEREFAPG